MKIGIIGFGQIGKTLAGKLSAAGHEVKVANSRGPETIAGEAADLGARAVTAPQAVDGADAVILSVPLTGLAKAAPIIAGLPATTVVIDTSNYYPFRDGAIAALDDGVPEGVWVSDQLRRPVIKAWNAVLSHTLAHGGKPEGAVDRIAVPIAGDDPAGKALASQLVSATGFDPVDAGALSESWRQQPGNPAYCTELSAQALKLALTQADATRAGARRDAIIKALMSRQVPPSHEEVVAANRAMTAGG
jgi:predicted dinucleotide-binding enzyme